MHFMSDLHFIACLAHSPRGLSRRISQLALAAGIFGVFGCSSDAKKEVTPETPREVGGDQAQLNGTRVEVAVVKPSSSGLTLRVPGEVEGVRDAELAAALGGYIEAVQVKEGQTVKQGAVLARVDTNTYSARLVRAQVERTAAERELARAESLGAAIPQAELDAARDRLASAQAGLGELQVAAGRSVVTAPFSGVVVRVDAEVGEVAGPGTPLFRLVQLKPVRVSVALSDRDMALAEVGMSASVELAARSGVHEGKVVQLSQAANLKTRSFEALVEVPNEDESLLPGMIAQVSLSTGSDEGQEAALRLLISQDWVVTKPSGVGVFVAKGGKAVWRPVQLGTVVRRQVEVLSGLASGDQLIIVGHRGLVDGDDVLIHRSGTCCHNGRAVFGQESASAADSTSDVSPQGK
jgi:membrane fusion protein (multidrug efflux system)